MAELSNHDGSKNDEIDTPLAVLATGHAVGTTEDFTLLTFVQGIPSWEGIDGEEIVTKFKPVANIAISNKLAISLAKKILSSLKADS